jgi:hypothetical protein
MQRGDIIIRPVALLSGLQRGGRNFRPVVLYSGQCSLVMADRQSVMSFLEALNLAGKGLNAFPVLFRVAVIRPKTEDCLRTKMRTVIRPKLVLE